MLKRLLLAAGLLFGGTNAYAQSTWATPGGSNADGKVEMGLDANGHAVPVSPTNPIPASDAQSAPYAGAVAMTVGTTYPAQRAVGILATVNGNAEFQLSDGSTVTLPVYAGWQVFPLAVTQIVAAGTTATATYYNLK